MVVRSSYINYPRYSAILIEVFRYHKFALSDYACMLSLNPCPLNLGTTCSVDSLVSTLLDCGVVRSLIGPASALITFEASNKYCPCYLREINRARIVPWWELAQTFATAGLLKRPPNPLLELWEGRFGSDLRGCVVWGEDNNISIYERRE